MKIELEMTPDAAASVALVLESVHANFRKAEMRPLFGELSEQDRAAVTAMREHVWHVWQGFAAAVPSLPPHRCRDCAEFAALCAGVGSCTHCRELLSGEAVACSFFWRRVTA